MVLGVHCALWMVKWSDHFLAEARVPAGGVARLGQIPPPSVTLTLTQIGRVICPNLATLPAGVLLA